MFRALFRALGQIGDPALLRPLLLAAALTGAAMLGLGWAVSAGLGMLAGGEGWIAGAAAAAGALLVLVALYWLFLPLVLVVAGLFLDGVAAAVEQRHYPHLPPAQGASVAAQAWAGLTLALRLAALTLLLLPLSLLLPVAGGLLLWAVAAIGLGEGLFATVAQRRMPVAAEAALRRRRRGAIWGVGAALALLALVPPLGLFAPVLGAAAMVHLLHDPQG